MYRQCACGLIPNKLETHDSRTRVSFVSGDCCSEWWIKFDNEYYPTTCAEYNELKEKAWNDAMRPMENI